MFNSKYIKDFKKVFEKFSYRYDRRDVWRDFVTLSACAISNTVDKVNFDSRESKYMDLIKTYPNEHAILFVELLVITTLALEENPNQDFLGELYTSLGLLKKGHAQYFTPYPVGMFMASICLGNMKSEIERKGYISICDSCCGAGCFLIAATNVACQQGVNFQEKVLFVAQDIDYTAAMMCYIQLSLLGCMAEIRVGNSLNNETLLSENIWHTPLYFLNAWKLNNKIKGEIV